MNEDDLIAATLHRAVSTLEPPTARLVAGGIARGRRRRRTVIGAEVLTGAALVAGVLAMVAVFLPGSHGGPASATGSSTPVAEAGTVPITPQALLQTALDTLPRPGRTSGYDGSATAGFVGAGFVYDDGHGAARVTVSLDYPPAGGGLGEACQISVCTTRADGSKLAVYQGNGHPGSPSIPGTEWEVTLLRADGVVVSITEWNSAKEKSATLTRAEPPFTVAELTAWASSGGWQTTITRQRDLATGKLFAPTDPKPAVSGAEASKQASALQRQMADHVKAAKLAEQRAECAAAKAAHEKLPAFCATIK